MIIIIIKKKKTIIIIIIITNRKKIDILNEILIETFSIFQITDCQLNYIFI